MDQGEQVRIEVDAAKALVDWQSFFADEVRRRAKGLAAQSDDPSRVTLGNYQEAAKFALEALAAAIETEHGPHGQKEAA